EDHVAQDIKVGVGKGRVGPPRNEDVRRVIRGRQQESVFDPAIPCPVDRGPHDVIDASDRSEVERSLNHVSLELFHVPGAVEFEEAFRLSEEAQTEGPDDPAARELYAVIHLARAIRLSDRAREARRQDLLRREIDFDEEFQDGPEVARAYDDAAAAIDDVLRV